MSTDINQSFSLIRAGSGILSYVEGTVQSGIEKYPVLTSVVAVALGFFGMRNITNAYSITSVVVGVVFMIPSYMFFRDVLNDFSEFKSRVLDSFKKNKIAQIALAIAYRFKEEVQNLSNTGSENFPVTIAAAFTSVFIYCITDLGIKTIGILAITALALLNVDKAKIYQGFQDVARQAVENIEKSSNEFELVK